MALIQEPYCYKGTLAAIPGRSDAIPSTRTGGPRAAIFADKRLKLRELTNLCTKDLAAGVCVIGNKQTMILSAYLDITRAVRYEALIKALEYRQEKRLGLILAIDCNAHSTLWGHSTNPRGIIMAEIMTEYGLLLQNRGKEFTYDCRLGRTVIDLTLTCNIGAGIRNWRVLKGLNFSDHNTIRFEIASEILELPPRRIWEKTDWIAFTAELEKTCWTEPAFISEKQMDIMVNKFTKEIGKALDIACPLTKACTVNKNNPWFTPQLKMLRNELGAAYDKAKQNSSSQNWDTYKDRLKRYKRLVKKTKNDHYAKYVDSIQDEEEMSYFAKRILKHSIAAKPTVLKRADSTHTKTPEEALQELASVHFPSNKTFEEKQIEALPINMSQQRRHICTPTEACVTTPPPLPHPVVVKKSPSRRPLKGAMLASTCVR